MKINDRNQKKQLDASVEGLFQARLTRREFFRRATALGVSAAVVTDILGLHGKAFAAEGPSPAVPSLHYRHPCSMNLSDLSLPYL